MSRHKNKHRLRQLLGGGAPPPGAPSSASGATPPGVAPLAAAPEQIMVLTGDPGTLAQVTPDDVEGDLLTQKLVAKETADAAFQNTVRLVLRRQGIGLLQGANVTVKKHEITGAAGILSFAAEKGYYLTPSKEQLDMARAKLALQRVAAAMPPPGKTPAAMPPPGKTLAGVGPPAPPLDDDDDDRDLVDHDEAPEKDVLAATLAGKQDILDSTPSPAGTNGKE